MAKHDGSCIQTIATCRSYLYYMAGKKESKLNNNEKK